MPSQIIYKFRNWSDPVHKRWLLNREIYFASPKQFNDPFDCAINYRYDLLSQEEKFEKCYDMQREINRLSSDDEIKRQAYNLLREGNLERDKLLENNKTIIRSMIQERVGILALTKTKDHILLWSHYSDYHRGICIGYDKDRLISDLKIKYNSFEKIFFGMDVNYIEKYPIIIPKKGITPEEYVRNPISTKAKYWEYEQEYRILLLNGARELTNVPDETINEITLGCNMSEQDQINIVEYVIKNLPKMNIYRAKMHDESFELVFDKIN
jgi:hypothetical protein